MELQQSPLYKKYIENLGWTVAVLDGVNIFIKRIPFCGVLAKIQRPSELPYVPKLIPFLKTYGVQKVALEPTADTDLEEFRKSLLILSRFFKIHKEPFLPTKTILVDLAHPEKDIFNAFTEAKRRAVRRAQKHGVIVKESDSIQDMLYIKNISAGFLGGITTYGIDKLWGLFAPKNAAILLAYHNDRIVGGILLLFHKQMASYWIAGATKKGKKLFAPTLLVWEALRLSKKRGCSHFDFVGVFDERSPKQFSSWHGFTKFKEGFGGREVYYPIYNPKQSEP